ncbi:DUF6611 family protein [Cryobacterium arcticum]|uniref:DUF6611 family protein n=1 Tax=Cryobacterium arcticum TaxID=670052 RepID=UPI0011B82C4F|nr:DUF6611 family protein [Cryobacterium arcticum]
MRRWEDADEVNNARTISSGILLNRWLSPVVDGRCRWGSYTVAVGRYGSVGYRLVVYPPGISAQQRRRVRLCRGWTILGLVGVLGVFVAMAEGGASRLVIVIGCVAFYALGAVVVARAAGPVRKQVLELTAARSTLVPDTWRGGECRYLASLAATLAAADQALQLGRSTPAEHEMVWSAVYSDAEEHMDAARTTP